MRATCLAVAVFSAGCGLGIIGDSAHPSDDPAVEQDTCGAGEGALPPPYCGEGACSCCGSCNPLAELCFTDDWSFSLGYGHCRSAPAAGSLQATIGGQAFAATEVAAIASDNYVQVAAGIGMIDVDRRQLAFQVPAQLGTYDCAAVPVTAVGYAGGASFAFNSVGAAPRPPCLVTLTAIGAVGERIEGSLAATLVDRGSGATLDIAGGTFSVERVPYP